MTDFRWRYLTLAEAQALECNQCGDCCDSSITDGNFTWGKLPKHQYRGIGGGAPLIIPIAKGDGTWTDRDWSPEDAVTNNGSVPFRCSALVKTEGGASCGLHDKRRPTICGMFPVRYPGMAEEVHSKGFMDLRVGGLERCTWYGVKIVPDDWQYMGLREDSGSLPWNDLTPEQCETILLLHPASQVAVL